MIPRKLFSSEHEEFRASFRRFLEKEVLPYHEAWEERGYVDREVWQKAGANGFLCPSMPEAYGGAGADRLYSMVMMEETARARTTGLGFSLHSEIVAPYIFKYGSEAQKTNYLPRMARGEIIGAIAMSEPGVGSDLQSVKTSAVKDGEGCYTVNGAKTFITNGWNADLVITVAKTNPALGAKGTSLILVERGMAGFERGKRLKKVGLKAQDTSELFFDNVKVPEENLLGAEGQGFVYLMQELPWERMQIAIGATASAQQAIEDTMAYVRERKVFGNAVASFQNTRFKLAELQAQVQMARVFVDQCMTLLLAGELDPPTAAMAKLTCTEIAGKVIDECLQLHGGYGFMWEYPIARAYADTRVSRIYGGTSEIMKEVIARSMGLGK